jgi:hypothetical protein
MTNPYRAMCAELVNELTRAANGLSNRTALAAHINDNHRALWAKDAYQAAARARALLDQPEPPELTDEELTLTYVYAVAAAVGNKRGPYTTEDAEAAQLAGLRAVLAKWGHQ